MALEKTITIEIIEVVQNGSVQVKTKTAIVEDGKEITASFHRHVVCPGDDFSNEDAKVQAICSVIQTPDVVAAYKTMIAENLPKVEA